MRQTIPRRTPTRYFKSLGENYCYYYYYYYYYYHYHHHHHHHHYYFITTHHNSSKTSNWHKIMSKNNKTVEIVNPYWELCSFFDIYLLNLFIYLKRISTKHQSNTHKTFPKNTHESEKQKFQ